MRLLAVPAPEATLEPRRTEPSLDQAGLSSTLPHAGLSEKLTAPKRSKVWCLGKWSPTGAAKLWVTETLNPTLTTLLRHCQAEPFLRTPKGWKPASGQSLPQWMP